MDLTNIERRRHNNNDTDSESDDDYWNGPRDRDQINTIETYKEPENNHRTKGEAIQTHLREVEKEELEEELRHFTNGYETKESQEDSDVDELRSLN